MINKNKKIKARKPVNKTTTKKVATKPVSAKKVAPKTTRKVTKPKAKSKITVQSVNSKQMNSTNPFERANVIKKNDKSYNLQTIAIDSNGLKIKKKTLKSNPTNDKLFREFLAKNKNRA